MATSKYINQVCVIGDRRKYLTALVTLDPETIGDWAAENGPRRPTSRSSGRTPRSSQLIEAEVQEKNQRARLLRDDQEDHPGRRVHDRERHADADDEGQAQRGDGAPRRRDRGDVPGVITGPRPRAALPATARPRASPSSPAARSASTSAVLVPGMSFNVT